MTGQLQRARPRAVNWSVIGREDAGKTKRWILDRIALDGNEGAAAKELCDELAGLLGPEAPSLSVVAWHVKTLVALGRLEAVRTDTVRGAAQTFYRVSESVLLSGQQEAELAMQATASNMPDPEGAIVEAVTDFGLVRPGAGLVLVPYTTGAIEVRIGVGTVGWVTRDMLEAFLRAAYGA